MILFSNIKKSPYCHKSFVRGCPSNLILCLNSEKRHFYHKSKISLHKKSDTSSNCLSSSNLSFSEYGPVLEKARRNNATTKYKTNEKLQCGNKKELWANILKSYAEKGRVDQVFLGLTSMKQMGILIDTQLKSYVFSYVFDAYIVTKDSKSAVNFICNLKPSERTKDHFDKALLVCGVAGDTFNSNKLIRFLREDGFEVDAGNLTSIMNAYALSNDVKGTMAVLNDMQSNDKVIPTIDNYDVILKACARTGNYSFAKEIFKHISDIGLQPSNKSWGHLCKSALIARNPEAAKEVLHDYIRLSDRESINHYLFNFLMEYFGDLNKFDEVEAVYNCMLTAGLRPNSVTFIAIIQRTVTWENKCIYDKYIDVMMPYGIIVDHLTCWKTAIIQLSWSGGYLGIEDLISKIQSNGLKPTGIMWRDLIAVYCKEDMVDEAIGVLERMKEIDDLSIYPDCYCHILLAMKNTDFPWREMHSFLVAARSGGCLVVEAMWAPVLEACAKQTKDVKSIAKLFNEMQRVNDIFIRGDNWSNIARSVVSTRVLGTAGVPNTGILGTWRADRVSFNEFEKELFRHLINESSVDMRGNLLHQLLQRNSPHIFMDKFEETRTFLKTLKEPPIAGWDFMLAKLAKKGYYEMCEIIMKDIFRHPRNLNMFYRIEDIRMYERNMTSGSSLSSLSLPYAGSVLWERTLWAYANAGRSNLSFLLGLLVLRHLALQPSESTSTSGLLAPMLPAGNTCSSTSNNNSNLYTEIDEIIKNLKISQFNLNFNSSSEEIQRVNSPLVKMAISRNMKFSPEYNFFLPLFTSGSKLGMPHAINKLMKILVKYFGIVPDKTMQTFVISAYVESGYGLACAEEFAVQQCIERLDAFKSSFGDDCTDVELEILTKDIVDLVEVLFMPILDYYISKNNFRDAGSLVLILKTKHLPIPASLLSKFVKYLSVECGLVEKSIEVTDAHFVRLNSYAYSKEDSSMEKLKEYLSRAIFGTSKSPLTSSVNDTGIISLASNTFLPAREDSARNNKSSTSMSPLFREVLSRHAKKDLQECSLPIWKSVLVGCVKHGKRDEAMWVFDLMRNKYSIYPDAECCAHMIEILCSLDRVNEACDLILSAASFGDIELRPQLWNPMIKHFAERGQVDDCLNIFSSIRDSIKSMKLRNSSPTTLQWKLVFECAIQFEKFDQVPKILDQMKSIDNISPSKNFFMGAVDALLAKKKYSELVEVLKALETFPNLSLENILPRKEIMARSGDMTLLENYLKNKYI